MHVETFGMEGVRPYWAVNISLLVTDAAGVSLEGTGVGVLDSGTTNVTTMVNDYSFISYNHELT